MKPLYFLLLFLLTPGAGGAQEDSTRYPLEVPILQCFQTGRFSALQEISQERVTVNLSEPFDIKGYFPSGKLVDALALQYRFFVLDSVEWYDRQIDVDSQIATQALRLKLRPLHSRLVLTYRIIFMLEKKQKRWKIFYLRGW